MEKNPEISIIVPIYNAEKFIDGCMQSIYAQTFTDYEIILVNDGSSDNSAEICQKYRDLDSRVTYLEKENGGAGSARNMGMKAAKGRYLAFPDVDDSFEPEMYEELYALADSKDYDVVFSGVKYYKQTENGNVYDREQNIEAVSFLNREDCRKNIMTFFPTTTIFDVPWNKLYKRSVAAENSIVFPDIRRCQDAAFNLEFFNCVNSAASINKAYYHYMENTQSDVQRKFPKDYFDISMIYYQRLIQIISSWGMYSGDIKRHYDTTVVISAYKAMEMFDNPRWGLSKEEQKQYVITILNRADLRGLLENADVREDALWMYRIIQDKDYGAFMRRYRKEKRKDKLRENKLLMKAYHPIKRN